MTKVKIQQLKFKLTHTEAMIEQKICDILRVKKEDLISYKVTKKSFDARKKQAILIVYSFEVTIKGDLQAGVVDGNNIMLTTNAGYEFPLNSHTLAKRPVIIGSGPSGLFCALMLAENGFKPIVLERGASVDERILDVHAFFKDHILKENSNIQFGEGGAGTYSDGKLNTQIKDALFRKEKILEEFIEAGAPDEIGYMSKPHIGTDYLIKVVKNIRHKIEKLGGEVRFNSQVTSFIIEQNTIKGVIINNEETLHSDTVVVAIGHSARDTFKVLSQLGVPMEQKAFAMGLRIEHPQEMISKSQFGTEFKHPHLPAADYKLTHKTYSGRGVYTFCMCPGGFVVNAASESGGVVCNGMSNFKRDAVNANSAVLVNITPEDFGSDDVLAGVEFQRKWEQKAFELAGSNFNLPVQLWRDFLNGNISEEFGEVKPNTKGHYTFADLNQCLPPYVAVALKEGILEFDLKISGFARADAVLTGIESRSSSPVRILRNDCYESTVSGLFPCGEGAGYAGGIMSAAMDGMKIAEQIAKNIR